MISTSAPAPLTDKLTRLLSFITAAKAQMPAEAEIFEQLVKEIQANEALESNSLIKIFRCMFEPLDNFALVGELGCKIIIFLIKNKLITREMLVHRGCQDILINESTIRQQLNQRATGWDYQANLLNWVAWEKVQAQVQALYAEQISMAIAKQAEFDRQNESKEVLPKSTPAVTVHSDHFNEFKQTGSSSNNQNFMEVLSWFEAYAAHHLSETDLLRALNFVLTRPQHWESFAKKADFVVGQLGMAIKGRCKTASARSILEHFFFSEMNKASLDELKPIIDYLLSNSPTLNKHLEALCTDPASFLERNFWAYTWQKRWNSIYDKIFALYEQKLKERKLTCDRFRDNEVKSIHTELLGILSEFKDAVSSPVAEYIQKIEEVIEGKKSPEEAKRDYFGSRRFQSETVLGQILTLCSQIVTESLDDKALLRISSEFDSKSPYTDIRYAPSLQKLLRFMLKHRLIRLSMLRETTPSGHTACFNLQKHLNGIKPFFWDNDRENAIWVELREQLLLYYKSLVDQTIWEYQSATEETYANSISNLEKLMTAHLLTYVPLIYLQRTVQIYQQADRSTRGLDQQISIVMYVLSEFNRSNQPDQTPLKELLHHFISHRLENANREGVNEIQSCLSSPQLSTQGKEIVGGESPWSAFIEEIKELANQRLANLPLASLSRV